MGVCLCLCLCVFAGFEGVSFWAGEGGGGSSRISVARTVCVGVEPQSAVYIAEARGQCNLDARSWRPSSTLNDQKTGVAGGRPCFYQQGVARHAACTLEAHGRLPAGARGHAGHVIPHGVGGTERNPLYLGEKGSPHFEHR